MLIFVVVELIWVTDEWLMDEEYLLENSGEMVKATSTKIDCI